MPSPAPAGSRPLTSAQAYPQHLGNPPLQQLAPGRGGEAGAEAGMYAGGEGGAPQEGEEAGEGSGGGAGEAETGRK